MRLRSALRRSHGDTPERGESGSALILVPAGFLVLMLLAGMAVDSAAVYLGQRQLGDATAAAANDAASAALDNNTFYSRGVLRIDAGRAARTVCSSMAAQEAGNLHDVRVEMALTPTQVEVRASASVDAIFGIEPRFSHRHVRADAVAVATTTAGFVEQPLDSFQTLSC